MKNSCKALSFIVWHVVVVLELFITLTTVICVTILGLAWEAEHRGLARLLREGDNAHVVWGKTTGLSLLTDTIWGFFVVRKLNL